MNGVKVTNLSANELDEICRESMSTKELIRGTLQKLLEEKEYTEISMKEIAQRANVGRRTLYRYFGTKDDIVKFMADSVMNEFAEALLAQDARSLKEVTNVYFSFWEKNAEVFHCLDQSHLLYYIEDHLSDYITQVAFKTKFKDIDKEPDELLAEMPKERIYDFYFKIAGYWELTKRWMREENRSTSGEISSLVVKILSEK